MDAKKEKAEKITPSAGRGAAFGDFRFRWKRQRRDIYRKSPSNCLDILKQIAIDIGLDYESDELNDKECLTIKAMDWNETPEEIANKILPILQKIELYIIKENQNI